MEEKLNLVKSEKGIPKMIGEVWAVQKFKDGTEIKHEIGKNIIVDNATIIVAQLLKNDPVNGLTHLAVGQGNVAWDPMAPPAAVSTQTELESEFYRKVFTSTRYVVMPGGTTSITATNNIELETTYDYAEAIGAIDEMGLFGINATNTLNSGSMFNARNFSVINKNTNSTLTFTWRISIL